MPVATTRTSGLHYRDEIDTALSGLVQIDHDLQGPSIRVSAYHPILVVPGLDVRFDQLYCPALQNRPDLQQVNLPFSHSFTRVLRDPDVETRKFMKEFV